MTSDLRRKRVWTIADFAAHIGLSHLQAKRRLHRLDRQLGGKLLIPSKGVNRGYTFVRAVLQRAHPEYFESVQSLEERVDELEEEVAELKAMLRRIACQTGANTRGIETLKEAARGRVSRAA